MADFSRRVPLDELRGRGLVKGLQPEVLEQISSWPSANAHGDEACTQTIAYTDGSACMTSGRGRRVLFGDAITVMRLENVSHNSQQTSCCS